MSSADGSVTFGAGPGTPPLGAGSARLFTGTDGSKAAEVRSSSLGGVKLAHVTALSYSTYVTSWNGGLTDGQAPYIILRVDKDANGSSDDLLFFEPLYSNGSYSNAFAAQSNPTTGTWQTWNARAGGWYSVYGTAGSGPGTGVITWDAFVAAYPDAKVINYTSTGGLRFLNGFAGTSDVYDTNVDNVTIGTDDGTTATTTTYDFEAPPAGTSSATFGSDGGTVTTDPDSSGPTSTETVVSVESQGSGTVSIVQDTAGTSPTGYSILGSELDITAPAATAADPLRLTFQVVDPGLPLEGIDVFRNGTKVEDCSATALSGSNADPDPCVESRTDLGSAVEIVVRTSQASTWSIAAAHPEVVFDTAPTATNSNTPQFTFHAEVGGTTVAADFTCQVTGHAEEACGTATTTPSYTTPDLSGDADGAKTLTVEATYSGYSGTGAHVFDLDRVKPVIAIVDRPVNPTNANDPEFTFTVQDDSPSSGVDNVSCLLDGGVAENGCTSPKGYTDIADGDRTFTLNAVDEAGNAADTESYAWTVDTAAPGTNLLTTPDDPTNATTASFTYEAVDSIPAGTSISFQCKLDTPTSTGSWTSCPSGGETYTGLVEGDHTFSVRARDAAGNVDGSPASFAWTVDLTLPTITIDYPADGGRYSIYKDVDSDWACTDTAPGTIVSQSGTVADGQPFPRTAPSGTPYTRTFVVSCTDDAGNTAMKTNTYQVMTFDQIVNDDDPQAYFRLNDAVGSDVLADLSGNGNDGEYKNATASWPEGISGDDDTSRYFGGADGGYAYVNGLEAPKSAYTLAGWVKFEDTGDASILDHGYDVGVYLKDQKFTYRHLGTTIADTTDVVADVWYFVAARWSGAQMRLYVAKAGDFLPTMVASATTLKKPSGYSTFYLGYGQDVPWLRGAMDEVAYFPSALSATHIDELWLADPPARVRESGGGGSGGGSPVTDAQPAAGAAAPAGTRQQSGTSDRPATKPSRKSSKRNRCAVGKAQKARGKGKSRKMSARANRARAKKAKRGKARSVTESCRNGKGKKAGRSKKAAKRKRR